VLFTNIYTLPHYQAACSDVQIIIKRVDCKFRQRHSGQMEGLKHIVGK